MHHAIINDVKKKGHLHSLIIHEVKQVEKSSVGLSPTWLRTADLSSAVQASTTQLYVILMCSMLHIYYGPINLTVTVACKSWRAVLI